MLPPGLYEAVLTPASADTAHPERVAGDWIARFEPRTLDDVRAIVLAGNGKSFSAGADLDWMRAAAGWNEAENQADAMGLSNMLAAINDCAKPVIVVAHGHVTGGGVGLVACADMAVAIEGAQFRLSEVRLGLTPATISPFVLAKIGAAARRWFWYSPLHSRR